MKLVAAKCPNCGANIDVDRDSDITKCEFCHSKIMVDDAIEKVKVEITGNVEIKNLPKYENYVTLADRYYNELMLREARNEYKKALELNPNNSKLIFREKICRACTMSFKKIDENIVEEAFKEVQKEIVDKAELSEYVKECSNAMAYIINKAIEYYQTNNLDYSEVVNVHYRISMCTINIWYFKNFIDDNDKETKLMLLEHYISACNLLTQDMKYKLPHSRSKGIYKVSYKEKKQYADNKRKAEIEREAILKENKNFNDKLNLDIHKSNCFSVEKSYIYFVIIFILNILFGIIFINYHSIFGLVICIINFIFLFTKIKFVKNNSTITKKTNIIGTVFLLLAIILGISNYEPAPEYINKWKNENMIIIINRKEAALKFSNNETIISGKYISNCDENNRCIISLGSYVFEYDNETLCYIENEQCSQNLEITTDEISLPVKSKDDICNSGETVTCSEKGYFICNNGVEHPENVCIFNEEQKKDKNTELIVSAVFAFCLLSFIEWATKRRK